MTESVPSSREINNAAGGNKACDSKACEQIDEKIEELLASLSCEPGTSPHSEVFSGFVLGISAM